MSVAEVIRHFSQRTDLSIDVNDVVDLVKAKGLQDEIEFIGVDYDTSIILGNFQKWTRRPGVYANPIYGVDIYFHRHLPLDWQRFVCCKELLHVFDPAFSLASTVEDIQKLTDRIGLPPEMHDWVKDGYPAMSDHIREYEALAVLLPMAARNQLAEPYEAGRVSLDAIARLADIPHRYVALAMHDAWPAVYERLMAMDGQEGA